MQLAVQLQHIGKIVFSGGPNIQFWIHVLSVPVYKIRIATLGAFQLIMRSMPEC